MSKVKVSNPFLTTEEPDFLSHFGITCTKEVRNHFEDVKFVCMSGASARVQLYADSFQQRSGVEMSENLSRTDRYVMYKTGKVLWINHGMGAPSISIMLYELIKLLHYAQASDVVFIRLGTSGGIGVDQGTVVTSTGNINGLLEPVFLQYVMGKEIKLDAKLDLSLCDELFEWGRKLGIPIEKGLTISTDDFYEGQARLNGAFCNYTKDDKTDFLQKLYSLGVRNMEMEGICFSAITHRAGIRSAIVCTTFINRLKEDLARIDEDRASFHEFEMRPFKIVLEFLLNKLNL